MARDRYLQPLVTEMRKLHEDIAQTPLEELFLTRLVWTVDPGTRRLTGITITGLAEWMSRTGHPVHRARMAKCIEELERRKVIRCDFPRGHSGWVELGGFYELMSPSAWLARQKAKAQELCRATRLMDGSQVAPRDKSPGETRESFYDSQGGAEGTPIDPASNGHGYLAQWARSLETWQLERTVDNERTRASRGDLDDVGRARLRTLLDELAARKATA